MRSKWWRRVCIVAAAMLALSLTVQTYLAISEGRPFVGQNYWGAPIGTYLLIPVLLVAIPIGLWWAIRKW